ncbi:MAG: hypothetical protein U0996_06770 [Planctomycetaceae bacterium]
MLLLSVSLPARCFILAVARFASILNPYLTTLNNHTPGVACAMFTISAAVRMLLNHSANFAALGFFAAMTSCFELPAAQLGIAAFVLAVFIDRKRTIAAFVPAAVLPLAFFFLTNWLATGGVKPFYATYGSETYRYVHNGIPSYWMNQRSRREPGTSSAVSLSLHPWTSRPAVSDAGFEPDAAGMVTETASDR